MPPEPLTAAQAPLGRILVVEGARTVRARVLDDLQQAGFEALGVASLAAVDSSLAADCSLVLLSAGPRASELPHAVELLRNQDALQDVPVIVLVDRESTQFVDPEMAAWAADFLTRPICTAELILRVRRAHTSNAAAQTSRADDHLDTLTDELRQLLRAAIFDEYEAALRQVIDLANNQQLGRGHDSLMVVVRTFLSATKGLVSAVDGLEMEAGVPKLPTNVEERLHRPHTGPKPHWSTKGLKRGSGTFSSRKGA